MMPALWNCVKYIGIRLRFSYSLAADGKYFSLNDMYLHADYHEKQ